MLENNTKEKYPIGECVYPEVYTQKDIEEYIHTLDTFPSVLEHTVQHLSEQQLQTCYRDGGWTINQVIHHCADSHMNMLIRLKLALTETNPIIKPYDEAAWATIADYDLPFNNSIVILYAVHKKIVRILKSITPEQQTRIYTHPQYMRQYTIQDIMCLYSWHCKHHLAHITTLLHKNNWT